MGKKKVLALNSNQKIFYGYYGNLRGVWLQKNQPELFQDLVENDELDKYLESYQKSYALKAQRLFTKLEEERGVNSDLYHNDYLSYMGLEYRISQEVKKILKKEIEQ